MSGEFGGPARRALEVDGDRRRGRRRSMAVRVRDRRSGRWADDGEVRALLALREVEMSAMFSRRGSWKARARLWETLATRLFQKGEDKFPKRTGSQCSRKYERCKSSKWAQRLIKELTAEAEAEAAAAQQGRSGSDSIGREAGSAPAEEAKEAEVASGSGKKEVEVASGSGKKPVLIPDLNEALELEDQ